MKKSATFISAILISGSVSAQLNLPIVGQLSSFDGLPLLSSLGGGGLPVLSSLGGGLALPSSGVSGLGLDVNFIFDLIGSDPLGVVGIATQGQSLGAPLLTPVLLQVAPLVDAGPALPLLAPILNSGTTLPGLPNLDFLM